MKQSWERGQQDALQQGPRAGKGWRSKLPTPSSVFLIAILALTGCKPGGAVKPESQGAQAPQNQARSSATSPQTPTPNPEVERQKQQVSETLARCKAIRKEAQNADLQVLKVLEEIMRETKAQAIFHGMGGRVETFKLSQLERKEKELISKRDKLRKNFTSCEGELRTLAQSDNADVSREAHLALSKLVGGQNEKRRQKAPKVAGNKQ
jgi:hypothetical protein